MNVFYFIFLYITGFLLLFLFLEQYSELVEANS